MKKQQTHKKLISRRTFMRRQSIIHQKHVWFFQGKDLELRPGWLSLLEEMLSKIKRILTVEDIAQSRFEYLYCATEYRLQVFVDASRLSEARFKVINHLLDKARNESESICPKCGVLYEQGHFSRSNLGCEVHREFVGDFVEDYRLHLTMKECDEDEEVIPQETVADELEGHFATGTVVEVELKDEDLATPQFRLYDIEEVQKIKQSLRNRTADSDNRNRIKSICDDMIERGGYRPYCRLPELDLFVELAQRFPNFAESIEVVSSAIALAKLGNGVLEIPPMLLVGPPGIGKTQVANEIASLLETDFLEIRMETEQSSAGLTGSSEFWSNTQVGLIFGTLTKGKTANPVVVLDELDKVSGDSRFNPAAGLYGLLERETAKRFEDQSIRGLPIDASGIIWLITANNETLIPEPIISRVMVQHICPPTQAESIMIAHNIYASIRKSRGWGNYFSPELNNSAAEKLANMEPRQMKVCLLNAFGKAATQSRSYIRSDDIPNAETSGGRIGFISVV